MAEWEAEGTLRFGTDKLLWKFVCPACGNVQCAEDFRPHLTPEQLKGTGDVVLFNCLGRYLDIEVHRPFGENKKGTPLQPCDYTAGGLFDLRPVTVVIDGIEAKCFDFAPATHTTEQVDKMMSSIFDASMKRHEDLMDQAFGQRVTKATGRLNIRRGGKKL